MAFRIVHQPNSHVHSIDQQYADDLSKVEIKCLCILDNEAIGSFICCSLDYCADTFCELECFDPSVRDQTVLDSQFGANSESNFAVHNKSIGARGKKSFCIFLDLWNYFYFSFTFVCV